MTRPIKIDSEKFVQRKVGMPIGDWKKVDERAMDKGWTTSRYIRNVLLNFVLGRLVKAEDIKDTTIPVVEELQLKDDTLRLLIDGEWKEFKML